MGKIWTPRTSRHLGRHFANQSPGKGESASTSSKRGDDASAEDGNSGAWGDFMIPSPFPWHLNPPCPCILPSEHSLVEELPHIRKWVTWSILIHVIPVINLHVKLTEPPPCWKYQMVWQPRHLRCFQPVKRPTEPTCLKIHRKCGKST